MVLAELVECPSQEEDIPGLNPYGLFFKFINLFIQYRSRWLNFADNENK